MVGMAPETSARLIRIVGRGAARVPETKRVTQIIHELQLNYGTRDAFALSAIRKPDSAGRHWIIRCWLHEYSLMRKTWKTKLKIEADLFEQRLTDAILRYVDGHIRCENLEAGAASRISSPELHAHFNGLLAKCRELKEIDLTSLTSKVLWLCFPNGAPIYDSYVRAALNPSRRGLGDEPMPSARTYKAFLRAWFDSYAPHRAKLEAFCRDRQNIYPMRLFDRALMLASPNAQ